VVIRIARSEMGQGTLTGLAQLVAEELECDWSKVTTEYPTPGQNSRPQPRLGQFLDRAAAAASANRTNMCARAARPRAEC
jgi:CO/xanthine dehydrogenase Mo-binding subunit